ncbi:MAG: hypothetical protein FWF53_02415 [Candidatus Azobacteroides sp.]|nr:hypothetical protein [Candidatus Azobacteroides sp.]
MRKISVLCFIALICILTISNCTSTQRKIDGIAKDINKQCPIALIGGTEKIISVEALSEKELKVNLQVNGTTGLDEEVQSLLSNAFKMIFASMAETNDDFKALKDMGASLILSITTRDSETMEVTITPEDLKNTEKTKLGKEGDKDETIAFIKITSESVKKLLPIIDKETGIKLIDCYADGMTMVYVLELPEEINETSVSGLKQAMIKTTKNNPTSMELVGKRGATLKLIFKKTDGSVVSEQEVSKADLLD